MCVCFKVTGYLLKFNRLNPEFLVLCMFYFSRGRDDLRFSVLDLEACIHSHILTLFVLESAVY
jgi:hypothetical protein